MKRIIQCCKKIRHLGKLGRWRLEESQVSPKNQIFLNYLKYCYKSLDMYIAEYISNMQPYMIAMIGKDTEAIRVVCAAENNYRLELYVMNRDNQEEVIVSFAEAYLQNETGFDVLPPAKRNDKIPVFADSIASHVCDTNQYVVNVMVPCGMQVFPFCVAGKKTEDVFEVMNTYLVKEAETIVEGALDNLDYDIDWDGKLFLPIQELRTYKWNVFNNMACILDYLFETSEFQKFYPGSLLVLYLQLLLFTEEQKEELLLMLKDKYRQGDDAEQQIVMHYIEDNIRII